MTKRILVVDDEEDLLELVRYNLTKEGFAVECVERGEEALTRCIADPPDVVLLDLMLPGMDGFETARRLKRDPRTAAVPVIMLTAKGEESDVVAGLELGADDYIVKPFSPKVLAARIRAVFRKLNPPPTDSEETKESILRLNGLVMDSERHEVFLDERRVGLTAGEFKILHFLASKPGRVFSRERIIMAVKGEDYPVTDRSVDVQIASLRKKLEPSEGLIETVRGVGYRFKE